MIGFFHGGDLPGLQYLLAAFIVLQIVLLLIAAILMIKAHIRSRRK